MGLAVRVESLFGPIPSSWEITSLGQVTRRTGGDIQTGPFGSQLHAADYVTQGIPSIMPKNIGDNRISTEDIARISEADAIRLQRYRVRAGDIVYSRRGDVEKRALIRPSEDGWLCGTGCLRVRFGGSSVSSEYASFYLGHPDVREWIVRHAHGATMPNLNTSILSELPFVVPPLPEQRAIAHILGALDDRIELNQRMNATLDELARTLFTSWFVDFDPVRARAEGRPPEGMDAETAALFPDRFVDSALGPIPEGWEWSTVGSEFDITMGQSPPGSTYNLTGDGMPFYQGRADFGSRFPSERVYCTGPTRLAAKGDTLISVRAPVGDANIALEKSAIGRGVAALRHQSGSESMTYHTVVSLAGRLSHFNGEGTVFGSINQRDLRSLPVVAPSAAIVTIFDRIVGPMDDKVEANESETRTLVELRDTLLPELLSGRVRVPVAERMVEAVS